MKPITKEQRVAVKRLYDRDVPSSTYKAFRNRFRWYLGGYIGAKVNGMFIGIETDGYAHT